MKARIESPYHPQVQMLTSIHLQKIPTVFEPSHPVEKPLKSY